MKLWFKRKHVHKCLHFVKKMETLLLGAKANYLLITAYKKKSEMVMLFFPGLCVSLTKLSQTTQDTF